MSVRIQLRRDTAANWIANNPSLREGEFGIELDTLKIKVGPEPVTGDSTPWNSITTYANIVPSDLNTTLGDYVLVNDIGAQGGVVGLNASYNAIVPGSSIIIEGPTSDSYETTLTVTDPTADRILTFPDEDGTIATEGYVDDAISAFDALPSQTGNTGKFLTTDGSATSWGTVDLTTKQDKVTGVSDTEISYLDGVTSAIQTQLNDKQAKISGVSDTEIGYLDGVTSAIQTQLNDKQPKISGVSDTEIGYLDGVTSAIQTQLDAKSPTASPTFTGTPAAPTPTAGTNTTQLATTAFVKKAVDDLIGGAGPALDTLNELASAINNDASYASTISTALGLKAPLASPTFTGTVTLPDNTISNVMMKDDSVDTAEIKDNAITNVKLADNAVDTAEIKDSAVTSAKIADGTIVNADINASAAIALSKLATDPLARANHTGSQTASTISDFTEAAQDAIGGILGTGLTYNDSSNTITVDSTNIQLRVSGVSDTEIGYLDGVTSSIQTQLDLNLASSIASTTYAPIASPTLTGTPAAPTATAGTNTTQIATTAFVKKSVDDLINGAGAAYDTLKELSDLIIADESTASSLATTVGNKAPKADPTFTGTVTLPLSTSGYVTTNSSGVISSVATVPNSGLTNSKVTVGTTDISLGASSTTLAGLTSVTSTSFTGALTGNASTVTDGVYTTGTYSNPAWITGLGWSKISSTPTTLSGYGITDSITSTTAASTYAPIAAPTFTGTVTLPSTTSIGNVSSTEIGYVDGVTSAIQTQLDAKLASSTASSTYAPLAAPALTGDATAVNLTVSGNLTVNGTTTNLNSTNLVIEDKNIVLGDVATPSNVTANGGGITLNGDTNKTFNWINATSAWTSSEHIDLASGKVLKIAGTEILSATQYTGNSATATSATSAGTVTNGVVTTGSYSDPTWITSLAWSKIASTPTTISGYGITNAVVTNAANTITAASASTKPLIIKGTTSQSANLQEWQRTDGTADLVVQPYGVLVSGGGVTIASNPTINGIGAPLVINSGVSTYPMAIFLAASGQSADITQWKNYGGTVVTKVDATGNITAPSLTLSSTALATTSGGTGLSSYTSGDIVYASATNTLAKLAKGTDGQVLTLASGVPSWAAAAVTYSAPTIGSTAISSGSTVTSISGLTLKDTSSTTISANTATTVDTNALAGFTTAKYVVSIKQGTKIRSSEVIVQTDGTSVDLTEFGITETGGTMTGVVVAATTVSTNAVLQVTITDASSTNATVKINKILI